MAEDLRADYHDISTASCAYDRGESPAVQKLITAASPTDIACVLSSEDERDVSFLAVKSSGRSENSPCQLAIAFFSPLPSHNSGYVFRYSPYVLVVCWGKEWVC